MLYDLGPTDPGPFGPDSQVPFFRLQDVWVFGSPQPDSVMAIVLPGWFDDSTRDDAQHRVAALGGCVGTAAQWAVQDAAWQRDVLDHFGLPDYHVKDFASFEGPYAQFEGNPARTLELSEAILGTLRKSRVRSFGAMVRLDDLRRFNRERGRNISHYALNIYTCMYSIRSIYREQLAGGGFAQMNMDISSDDEGTNQAIRLANLYAATHPDSWGGRIGNVAAAPMPKEGMARHTPALQAADFIANEVRHFTQDRRDFYDARPDGESTQEQRDALTEWADKTARKSPFHRGSMRALMLSPAYAVPFMWHFNFLCHFDDQRGGVWAPKDRERQS